MPTQARPYEFIPGIRAQAEQLRVTSYREAIRGSIALHSITADKIAVGVLNVGSGAVTIDSGVITGDKLAVRTITTDRIAVGNVTNSEIADGTVTGVEIADGTITAGKMNVGALSAITADLGTITAGTITGATFQTGTGVPRTVIDANGITSADQPTSEAVNASPSHWDFYDDASAQKGTVVCFIGDTSSGKAPHLTMRALCPSNRTIGGLGRASLAAWSGGAEKASYSAYGTAGVIARTMDGGFLATVLDNVGNGTWSDGDLRAHAFTVISDRKLKKNVRKLRGGLDVISQLQPVAYERRSDSSAAVGFVAQDVGAAIPTAGEDVGLSPDRKDGLPTDTAVGYDVVGVVAHSVAALQELVGRVEALERSKG